MKKNVEMRTLVRTAVLLLALLNQFLEMAGFCPLPVEEEAWYELLTGIFTTAASIWAWWKNNSFTQKALAADEWKKSSEKQAALKEE